MTYSKIKDKKKVVIKSDLDSLKLAMSNAKIDYFDINIATGDEFRTSEITKQLGYDTFEVDSLEKRNNLIHIEDAEATIKKIQLLIDGEINNLNIDYRFKAKNGTYIWLNHIGSTKLNDLTNEKQYIGILRDITIEKENLTILDYSLMHDELTNAYSRKYGLEKLEEFFILNHKFAVVYLDIDNLKKINDTYGHKKGDELLAGFVSFLRSKIRDDDFIIRLGGDEFIIVFENIKTDELLKKMIAISIPETSFSFGISDTTEGFKTVKNLIDAADTRMYSNKKEKYKHNSKN